MTILHVTRDLPPRDAGGISTAVGGLVRHLGGRGIDQAVVSFDGYRSRDRSPSPGPPGLEERTGVATARVVHPGQVADAIDWARSQDPRIVHCHDDLLWDFVTDIGCGTNVTTPHVLQRAQNDLRGVEGETMSSAAQDRSLQEADAVIALSQFAKDRLSASHPGSAAKIGIARLGIDLEPEMDAKGAGSGPKSGVAFAGRLSDVKGIGELIEALPKLETSTSITIVGGCPESPKAERRWHRAALEAAESSRATVELCGWLPRARALEVLARARIIVVPSWIETFGLVCVEAMLLGAAVIASDIPPLREHIEPGHTGLLVPARDAASLARAIDKLVVDHESTAALGAAAMTKSTSASWDYCIDDWLSKYAAIG